MTPRLSLLCVLLALLLALSACALPSREGNRDAASASAPVGASSRGSPSSDSGAARHDTLETCSAALSLPPGGEAPAAPPQLSVMSWNTMKYDREGSRDLLRRLGEHVDLVLLQEATRRDAPAPGRPWQRYFADGYRTWRELQTGVELRSRFPADTVCTLRFTEPWLRSPKAVLATRLAFAEYALLVVNLHAINFTFGPAAYAAQLDAIGSLLAAHAGPAIVAGDFNNWNGVRQETFEDFVRRWELTVTRFVPDWRSQHFGVPVDGLLQRGLEILDATALPTSRSDHHPLIVRLRPREETVPAGPHAAGGAPDHAP